MSDTAVATQTRFTVNLTVLKKRLGPAFDIATKGTLKDFADANRLMLDVSEDELVVSSYGGRLACRINVTNINDPDLEYKGESEGKFTVNAVDFQKSLDSFPPNEKIVVEGNDNSVTIAKASDEEEKQELPTFKEDITLPAMATSFEKEVVIDRSLFIEGIKRTSWAVGFEDHKEQYFYQFVSCQKDRVRFAAATGGRFAILDLEPSDKAVVNFIKTPQRNDFYFHKDQTSTLLGIVNGVEPDNNEFIKIKQAERSNDTPDQMVISLNNLDIMFVGFNADIKWPQIEKTLDKDDRPYKLSTKVSDWTYATKGLMATFNEDVKKDHDTHESDIEAKIEKNYILLTAKTNMKAQRKVPIMNVIKAGDKKEGLEFHCSTQYIAEITSRINADAQIEFQYYDDTQRPVFIIGGTEPVSALGVNKKFTMFIATMKK